MITVSPYLVPGQGTWTSFGKNATFRYTTPTAEPNVLLEEARGYFKVSVVRCFETDGGVI